jgi:hypothetical protein
LIFGALCSHALAWFSSANSNRKKNFRDSQHLIYLAWLLIVLGTCERE